MDNTNIENALVRRWYQSKIPTNNLAIKICEALGLRANEVAELTLRFEASDDMNLTLVTYVDVRMELVNEVASEALQSIDWGSYLKPVDEL